MPAFPALTFSGNADWVEVKASSGNFAVKEPDESDNFKEALAKAIPNLVERIQMAHSLGHEKIKAIYKECLNLEKQPDSVFADYLKKYKSEV